MYFMVSKALVALTKELAGIVYSIFLEGRVSGGVYEDRTRVSEKEGARVEKIKRSGESEGERRSAKK